MRATQSHKGWEGISGGAVLNSADQGLKDEISRIYFTKIFEEYDVKRKLINPESTYIYKKTSVS